MMDCAAKEGWNSYLIGIIFLRDCNEQDRLKVGRKLAMYWSNFSYISVTIGRVYEVLVGTHALYCFMIPWMIIQ